MRLRRRLFGLRPRLLAALFLTSAVTLGVAALALLSPLEQRLREDSESTVLTALATARPDLTEIEVDPRSGRLNQPETHRTALLLRRRSQASLTILDARLDIVYAGASTLDVPDFYGAARRALSTGKTIHTLREGELIVTERLKISGRRYVVVLTKRLDYVSSAGRVVQTAFIEAAAAGLLVALLLGFGIATTLLRRLERLRDATLGLEPSASGNGSVVAAIPEDRSPDEVGQLTRAFAAMQSRLRSQEAARRAFVATASHELRTPLASLDGVLELLADDLDPAQLDLEDARQRTTRAREQARTLSHLASDLLDLSRLDAEVELRSEPLELGELCRAVVAELELDARRHHVELRLALPGEPCWAQGDPGAVARIARILIDNALGVSPPRSSVEVGVAADGEGALLTVRDHGPGVGRAERELIFERFQRGSATGGRSGFGLGLAIGRELAVRMGGGLTLLDDETISPPGIPDDPAGAGRRGSGACFQLRLPAAGALE